MTPEPKYRPGPHQHTYFHTYFGVIGEGKTICLSLEYTFSPVNYQSVKHGEARGRNWTIERNSLLERKKESAKRGHKRKNITKEEYAAQNDPRPSSIIVSFPPPIHEDLSTLLSVLLLDFWTSL